MTIDEAIADIRDNIKPVVGRISLDMAIEALEQQKYNDYLIKRIIRALTSGYYGVSGTALTNENVSHETKQKLNSLYGKMVTYDDTDSIADGMKYTE